MIPAGASVHRITGSALSTASIARPSATGSKAMDPIHKIPAAAPPATRPRWR
ncbi:MAG: hypothetical protein ACT4OM_12575 [Actinomycetota bacterium]